jgi:Tfp pilus assembly protein PilX
MLDVLMIRDRTRIGMTTMQRQRGVAMVIGMIMLVLITLLVVSSINSGSVNLRIAGNMQAEEGARAVAQQAVEQVMGASANFYPTPTGINYNSATKSAQSTTPNYDINNDGTNEYLVWVAAPVCKVAAKEVPGRTTDCINGARAGLYCWDTVWEVVGTATDVKTGVKQVITQGVTIRFAPGFNPATVNC